MLYVEILICLTYCVQNMKICLDIHGVMLKMYQKVE